MLLLFAAQAQSEPLTLEAEVLEAARVVVPGFDGPAVTYAIVHHKHGEDQARLSAWLRQHASAAVAFETQDGAQHAAVLQRLKHCFGRGLLLFRDAIPLQEKSVVRLRLSADR
jgi:hypothetical protein